MLTYAPLLIMRPAIELCSEVILLCSSPAAFRRAETEADVIGSRIMARACFEPSAALKMLEKLDKLEKQSKAVPNLLRTHPVTADRIERMQSEMAEAERVYADSNC